MVQEMGDELCAELGVAASTVNYGANSSALSKQSNVDFEGEDFEEDNFRE